ncbi:MAG: bifunctional phosphopantothenoylcysteine decarboxylase/phosphopantothenate--cysteine ligase CoaBC [Pelagibacterales bacterium]|nr:bifunctional phosphopantothenoylcysteine decarboxylase/phosphopantothenate--cysteine ligase CoaBC [Pelagibacterales bacterium]
MKKKKILLIITGSIASYKALTLIRLLKNINISLNCILTKSAEKFITPLSVSSLTGNKVYSDLFSLDDEMEMGHIKLAKENDLVIVAPASANFISKVANGLADDLASTALLASKSPTFIFPAMNGNMLNNPFIKKNIKKLEDAGYKVFDTENGELACGDLGYGRMQEPDEIVKVIQKFILKKKEIFKGINALVTAGPTQEPIDPVRYISNQSSGKQGYAIAEQLADMGANVCLISGPTNIEQPDNIKNFFKVKTAEQMFKMCLKNIPSDLFISVAAVADWKVQNYNKNKLKKSESNISFKLTENKDILKFISTHNKRPKLVVGFAAETKDIKKNSILKLKRKKCDLIVANDVSLNSDVIGGDKNSVHIYNNSNCLAKYINMDKSELSSRMLVDVIHPLLEKKNNIKLIHKNELDAEK